MSSRCRWTGLFAGSSTVFGWGNDASASGGSLYPAGQPMMLGNNAIGSVRFDCCFGDVASPWLSCDFGVALDGVVAVAEQFGDKGRRRRHDEALQGGISRAKQIDAQSSEPFHDLFGLTMPAGTHTRKQPRAGCYSACRSEMGAAVHVASEHVCEWGRYGDRLFPQRDAHVVFCERDC